MSGQKCRSANVWKVLCAGVRLSLLKGCDFVFWKWETQSQSSAWACVNWGMKVPFKCQYF